ncbi:MAG: hypothetical protein SGPRY_007189 [Prymnesium sp.]
MAHSSSTCAGVQQPTITPAGENSNAGMRAMQLPSAGMPLMEMHASAQKRCQSNEERRAREDSVGGMPVSVTAMADDESAMNLEQSLQSCNAHRERILQMLAEDPDNQNLLELREQLSNAINQLQGTKTMVQRAQVGRDPGLSGLPHTGVMQGMGVDGLRKKSHSSRKNKPQRCSICGGIGHKSRTCTMALRQQAQNPAHVQWNSGAPAGPQATQAQGGQPHVWPGAASGCVPTHMGDGTPMFVPVPASGGCGGYVITTQNGQQQIMQSGSGTVIPPGMVMHSMPMGVQPVMVASNMCVPMHPISASADAAAISCSGSMADASMASKEDEQKAASLDKSEGSHEASPGGE